MKQYQIGKTGTTVTEENLHILIQGYRDAGWSIRRANKPSEPDVFVVSRKGDKTRVYTEKV